jgi:signal recognition particle subunit SRP14
VTIDKDITNVGLEDIKSPEKPYAILFKATDGLSDKKKRVKISTVVDADELTKFWMSYTELMKIGMSGLRKKEKKRKPKKPKKT